MSDSVSVSFGNYKLPISVSPIDSNSTYFIDYEPYSVAG